MADLREELPYRVEYAKTGRAGCKKCKNPIAKDDVRLAVMIQSPFFDGKQANWHHFDCFFERFRPKVEEIAHFADLKYEDQKKVEKAIESSVAPTEPSAGKGKSKARKKKAEDSVPAATNDLTDFQVEYSPNNRAKCRLCESTCSKETIRIGKMDKDSAEAHRWGPFYRQFHVECFVTARESLAFYDSADKIPNFGSLSPEDQKDLKKKLPAIKAPEIDPAKNGGPSPAKKPKLSAADEKKLKKQSDILFKYKKFAEEMKKAHLIELMEYNNIEVPSINSSKYERLADAMAFGSLEKCPECKDGQLVFRLNGYICTGNMNEWTKCEYQTKDKPKRVPFKVPKELAEEYEELKKYKFKSGERLLNPTLKNALESAASTSTATPLPALPKKEANGSTGPLSGYKIVCAGKLKESKTKLKSRLEKLGATLVNVVDRTTLCIVSTKGEVKKEGQQMTDAKELLIPVVSEEFIAGVENGSEPIQVINMNRLDSNEIDVEKRFNNLNLKEKLNAIKSGKSGSGNFEQKSGKQKMVLKDGNVVDPDCEVADKTHIYKEGKDVYNAVLSKVELSSNKNSFYKIQLLKHDSRNKYYVFRSWGRVGTTIGGTKLDDFNDKEDAIESFKEVFYTQTQNDWDNRKKFKKKANSYYPIDIDYGGDKQLDKLDMKTSKSSLPNAVQNLICMIFDVEKMKEQMLEFELDLEKMPLGKLSKKQLLKACKVLKEISKLIDKKPLEMAKIKDASNRFYTMIPHSMGTERLPLIDTEEMIKSKMDMLESLLDIEMAYEMINATDEKTEKWDPIDQHYQKLNAKIEPLTKDSEEFTIIEKYLKNTHGSTHNFELDIEEVFKVERHGERDVYQKHKDLERMLLWHGSRVTNFPGILSQGLRIAPPEAPVTGYMFGKGIYFADMVTKSAGYCYHHQNKNTGLLLLSEVAVGKTLELFDAKDVTKLPKDTHSVMGVGKTLPDPDEWHVLPDGVKVPCGKPLTVDKKGEKKCSLLYNEYIVYDTSQVNIKYLLKCKFNTKSLF